MRIISEWAWHKVFLDGESIIKIPKHPWNINEVSKLVTYAKSKFWEIMVDTTIEPDNNIGYVIKQPFVTWEHINTENIKDVLEKFNILLKLHLESINDNGIGLDFFWLEWSIKFVIFSASNLKWWKIDKILITPFFKFLSEKEGISGRILGFWEQWVIPELANVMIDNNWNIKIVDISLTNKKSMYLKERWKYMVIEFWNKVFLKNYFWITY